MPRKRQTEGPSDRMSIIIGDNARNVAAGKDIRQVIGPGSQKAESAEQPETLKARRHQSVTSLKGGVDFGIITIREDEFRAVLQRFPPSDYVEGNRRYAVAHIQTVGPDHSTVGMVRCPEQGTGEGQDTARDMIEDLDPHWLLLVGIAGAIPAYEFTLGDVVIATRLHDFSVEATIEGHETEYGVAGGPMHKVVQDFLALLPAMDEHLGSWNDDKSIGVGRPSVELEPSNFYGDEEWQRHVKEVLSRHFSPASADRPPLYTTGSVASSDRLVKNTQTTKAWRGAARQLLAVEMELAGVYRAARRKEREYPILAIRGISDIVGFKRQPDWTAYACQTAAAFTLALVKSGMIKPLSSRSR